VTFRPTRRELLAGAVGLTAVSWLGRHRLRQFYGHGYVAGGY
jgi:hypothetical protein